MKDEERILDWRSTGRRKARRVLFLERVPFKCAGFEWMGYHHDCNKTTIEPPKDAPTWFEEIWPEENRVLTQLQADHESKDLTQNDLEHLNWRCPSCHKYQDQQTDKGVATVTKNSNWGLEITESNNPLINNETPAKNNWGLD